MKIKRLQNINGNYYWNPSNKLKSMGYNRIALGKCPINAQTMAIKQNDMVAQQIINNATVGGVSIGGMITTAQLVDEYLSSRAFGELSKSTQSLYELAGKTITERFGNLAIDTIKNKQVAEWYHTRTEHSLSLASQELRFLHRLCNWGIENSLCEHNPANKIRKKSVPTRRGTWTDEQFELITSTAETLGMIQLADLLYIARFTAQRIGDCIALNWTAIDFKTNTIQFQQQKTGTELSIPMIGVLQGRLQQIRNRTAPHLGQIATGAKYDQIRKQFGRIKKQLTHRTDIQPLIFHDLRRTVAKSIADAGGTVEDYMSISGHKTPGQAAQYWQSGEISRIRAIEKINLKTKEQ